MCDSKICSKCKIDKPLDCFGIATREKSGRSSDCKACRNAGWAERGSKLPSAKKPKQRSLTNAERYAQYQATLAARIGPPMPPKPRVRKAGQPQPHIIDGVSKWHRRSERDKAHQQFLTTMRNKRCKQATPAYADRAAMEGIYLTARQLSSLSGVKFHVDHIIPLTNPYVCGLNVETNLRVIPAHENVTKKNKFEPHDVEASTVGFIGGATTSNIATLSDSI